MTLTGFVPLPLLVNGEFIYSTGSSASTAKESICHCNLKIHFGRGKTTGLVGYIVEATRARKRNRLNKPKKEGSCSRLTKTLSRDAWILGKEITPPSRRVIDVTAFALLRASRRTIPVKKRSYAIDTGRKES
jgi:hypothetical protein